MATNKKKLTANQKLLRGNLVATGILAIATIFLVLATIQMARTTQNAYEINTKPSITIGHNIGIGPEGNIRIDISNIGKIPLQYEVDNISINNKSILPLNIFYTILYPQQPSIRFGTSILRNNINIDDELIVKIIFWDPEHPKEKYYFKRHLQFRGDGWYPNKNDELGRYNF